MKKVQCYSCGGTGVLRGRGRTRLVGNETHQCYRCKGFGFVLKDHTKLSKFYNKQSKARFIEFWELQEFTGLVKVKNIDNVFIPERGFIPYSVFYKEHKNSK